MAIKPVSRPVIIDKPHVKKFADVTRDYETGKVITPEPVTVKPEPVTVKPEPVTVKPEPVKQSGFVINKEDILNGSVSTGGIAGGINRSSITQNTNKMAWKPKTIFGKIIKGAAVGVGSVLSLATGVGAIKGIASGAGIASGIIGAVKSVPKTVDKVAQSAINLVTGTTKDEREIIKQERQETREANRKLNVVEKLVKAGATVSEARAKLGITSEELENYDGAPVKSAGLSELLTTYKTPLMIAAGVFGAIFLLPKIKKLR